MTSSSSLLLTAARRRRALLCPKVPVDGWINGVPAVIRNTLPYYFLETEPGNTSNVIVGLMFMFFFDFLFVCYHYVW